MSDAQRPDPVDLATEPIHDPRRLAAVHATGLLDTASEEPFDRLSRLAASILGTPMAFMTVVDTERSFWKSRIGVPEGVVQNTVEESFCQYVVRSGDALIVGDAAMHPVTKDNPSVEGMGVRAWAGFPVTSPDGQVLGTFCVVDTQPRSFNADQVEALGSLAEAASAEIALRLALQEVSELNDTLRESLLPAGLPDVPGLDVASRHIPASDGSGVLGDFYDAFEVNGRWWFPLGDVCGHGPAAAKTTALARWSIRAHAARTDDPGQVARSLNAQMLARQEDNPPHLTLVLASVTVEATAQDPVPIDLAVSGHPPARVLRADGAVDVLDAQGTALGWFDDVVVGMGRAELAPGDALVLVTDGVLEAGDRRDMLGEDGLDEALRTVGGRSAEDVVAAVVAAADAMNEDYLDDIAVVVLANPAA